jgi:hypothetical protein
VGDAIGQSLPIAVGVMASPPRAMGSEPVGDGIVVR